MPELAAWQWLFGVISALMIGVAKTGAPGAGTLVIPLMVLAVGDARHAAAWTAPILTTGDIFAVLYWRRHADARKLFSLIPWVLVGMTGGAMALALPERIMRRMVGAIVLSMLFLYLARRRNPAGHVGGKPLLYGVAAGFATTVANAAGPVMNMYLLTRKLPKEQFVATGAWFFFVVNVAKMPIYVSYGLVSRTSLLFDLMMVPAVICGGLGGLWVMRRMPQRVFETMVIVLTAISSLLLFR